MKIFLRTLTFILVSGFCSVTLAADAMDLWFSPGWKTKAAKAKSISKSLSDKSGLTIRPRIAKGYPEILKAFDSDKASFVYVGSFVQAIIRSRGLGEGLVQGVTGKELYSGVFIYPKGQDPEAILKSDPTKIAFAVGASSGESSAKAATDGKATLKTKNHKATVGAIKAGKAKGGFVKNWWWESNGKNYADMAMYKVPGISETKNPDNVLAASKSVSADIREKIKEAAKASKNEFGAKEMRDFDPAVLDFSLSLMKKGHIDPQTYTW